MSRVTVAPAPATPAAPPRPGGSLRRLRRIGCLVLAAKLAGFAVWSALLYHRFALTPDFAQYQQAWYLIAHGHLNPYDTVGNFTFWQNHAEFLMWPIALLYWVFPSGVTLLWLQDIGVVGAELVAFLWICQLAGEAGRGAAVSPPGRRAPGRPVLSAGEAGCGAAVSPPSQRMRGVGVAPGLAERGGSGGSPPRASTAG